MPSLVKTLKNKASQARLRNNQATILEEPLPDLPIHGDYRSSSVNSRKSFWRKRDSPQPEVKSPNLTSLSPPEPPKSILRPYNTRSATLPQDRRHTLVPYTEAYNDFVPQRPESARTSTPPNKDWRASQLTVAQPQPRRASVRWSPPLHAPKPVTPRNIPMLSSPISLDSPRDSPPSSSPQTPTTPACQTLPVRRSSRPPSSASSRVLARMSTASSDAHPARSASAASMSSRRKSSRPGSMMSCSTRSSIASISTLTSSREVHVQAPPTYISYYVVPQQPAPQPQPRPRSIARKPVPSLVDVDIPLPMKVSPTPSFNIIPPTPDTAGESFENAAFTPGRSSTCSERRTSIILLDTMPEEDEEEGVKTPKLEAPIQLENVKQLDDLEGELEESSSDDCQTPNDVEVSKVSPPRLSPRGARTPSRKWSALYGGYDDGRSISRSLAELAALACDLPPFDDTLAENAAHLSEAHRRFLAARALVDATESPDLSSTPKARPAATAPPAGPLPVRPATEAPIIPPRSHRRPSVRYRKRAESTDTFGSQGSVPSLVSHDSAVSVSSGFGSSSSQSSIGSPNMNMEDATNVLRSMTLEGVQLPSTPKAQTKKMPSSLPETPNPGLGLGLVLDAGGLATHTPKHLRSSSDDSNASSSPKRQPIVRADPRRSGFYGTPIAYQSMTSIRSLISVQEDAAPRHHLRQGSVASSLASNVSDEDELLSASIVAITPGAVTHIVGREDPRAHGIGVAL